MKTYSVSEDEKGYSFVKGNTKHLKDMNQDELAILAKNGDTRVTVEEKQGEDKKSAKPVIPATV